VCTRASRSLLPQAEEAVTQLTDMVQNVKSKVPHTRIPKIKAPPFRVGTAAPRESRERSYAAES